MPREICDGVWHLPLRLVNVYLIQTGEGALLIDAGTPWDGTHLLQMLQRLGIRRGDVRAILLTHGDFDHMGSAAFLSDELGVGIWVHDAEAEAIAGRAPLRRQIVGDVLTRFWTRLGRRLIRMRAVEPVRTLTDGEMIDRLHVLHTPGHTDGHIALFDTAHCLLIGGDLVRTGGRRQPYRRPFVLADAEAQRRSLQRVATMQFDRAIFGHGPPLLDDADHLFRAALPTLLP